jgi:hypothetical protein
MKDNTETLTLKIYKESGGYTFNSFKNTLERVIKEEVKTGTGAQIVPKKKDFDYFQEFYY